MWHEIVKMFRGAGDQTAAAMRAALADVEARMPGAAKALDVAQEERARLLLEGTDRDVIAAEGRIDAARIEADRLDAAAAELRRRLAEAERREEAEGVRRQIEEASAASARAVRRLRGEGARYCQLLAEIVGEAREADRMVGEAAAVALRHGLPPPARIAEQAFGLSPVGLPLGSLGDYHLPACGDFPGMGVVPPAVPAFAALAAPEETSRR